MTAGGRRSVQGEARCTASLSYVGDVISTLLRRYASSPALSSGAAFGISSSDRINADVVEAPYIASPKYNASV